MVDALMRVAELEEYPHVLDVATEAERRLRRDEVGEVGERFLVVHAGRDLAPGVAAKYRREETEKAHRVAAVALQGLP